MSDRRKSVRLLGISGSLRNGSFCTAVIEALRDRMAANGKADVTLFPLHDIPLYNADHDGDTPPEPVKALRQAIDDAEGMLICSPEYNHGISGVLKNALDWASRPAFKSTLIGKPVLILTASPAATGGVRAQYQTREALVSCMCKVTLTPEVVIPAVYQKFTDGAFSDEATLSFTENAIDTLIADIQ